MVTTIETRNHHNVLVMDHYIEIDSLPDFPADMFDAIYIQSTNLGDVRNFIHQLNPVTSNKCSYKPVFACREMEGKLSIYGSLVDAYSDDMDSDLVEETIRRIELNCQDYGIQRETEAIANSNALFVRIFRYMISRGNLLAKPEIREVASTGYALPIFELFHHFGFYHLAEYFSFEQLMLEHGYIRPVEFINKIYLCPNCQHSHMIYIETCPRCGKSDIDCEEVIHHFRCANVSPEHTYNRGGQLVCPKCDRPLRHIGVDYDRPARVYTCNSCSNTFITPETKAICTNCKQTHPVSDLTPRELRSFEFTTDGIRALNSAAIGYTVYTDFYDNYLDYGKFISRVRMLIAARGNKSDQTIVEDMTVGKIWILNDQNATINIAAPIVADCCRFFKNHKVSVSNNILYVSNIITNENEDFAIENFRVEISEAMRRIVKHLQPGQKVNYTCALLDQNVDTVQTYIQSLNFVAAKPDDSYSYDDWKAEQASYTDTPDVRPDHYIPDTKL